MAYKVKRDPLNEYFTMAINGLLKEMEIKEIDPNQLRDFSIYSKYQGTNKPETSIHIILRDYSMLSLEFKKGKLKSSGWLNFKDFKK